MRRTLAPLLVSSLALVSASSYAADADTNVRLAKQFFDKAVQRMEGGRCETAPVADEGACREARDLLQRAYSLYPAGLGALRNLARVERSLGMYASAATHFRELVRRAPSDPKPSRRIWAEFARKEAEEIEPSIAHVVVRTRDDALRDLAVVLDGAALPAEAIGVPYDLDPGEHTLDATAPGRLPFHASVRVREGETRSVMVALDAMPADREPDPPRPIAPAPVLAAPTPAAPPPHRASRLPPLLLAGGGALVTAVGLGLGWVAIQKRVDACGSGTLCDPHDFESGKSFATASTVVTAVGATALVAGGVWFLLSAPHRSTSAAWVSPSLSPTFLGVRANASF